MDKVTAFMAWLDNERMENGNWEGYKNKKGGNDGEK